MKKSIITKVKQIRDEADHIIGTEADYPEEVAIENLKRIKSLTEKALKELKK